MSGSPSSRRGKLDRFFYGTAGMTPIVAMFAAPQPAVAALLPAANTVGVCSGVSLPKSTVTNLVTPIVQAGIQPIETTTNAILHDGLLSNLLGSVLSNTTLNVDLSSTVAQVSAGAPITLQVLSDSGAVLGPQATCYARADGVTLTAPAGIAIGGNLISGLGDTLQPAASAGDINSIAFGNKATSDAGAKASVAIGTNSTIGAAGSGAVAIGTASGVSALNGIALGAAAQASGTGGIAIGGGATVPAANSVALGAGSTAARGAATYTGYALTVPTLSAGEVSVGAVGATRQVTNVAAGLAGTDAVNVDQLTAVDTQVQTATTAIGALTTTVTKNTADIATNAGDIGSLKTSVSKNTADIATNIGDIAGLKTSVGQNTAAITADTASIGALGTRVTATESDVVGLTGQVSANTGDIVGLRTSVTKNTADITTNTGDIAGLKTSVGQNTAAITADTASIGALGTRVTATEGDVVGLTGQVTANTGDIVGLRTSVTKNTADITTNTGDIAGLKTNVGQNTAAITADTASIGDLGTRVTATEGDVVGLTGQVSANTGDIVGLRTSVTKNTADITTNIGDIAGLKTSVGQNTAAITADTASIGDLDTRVTATEGDVVGLTGQVSANTGDIAALGTSVAANTGDITSIDARVTGNTATIALDTAAISALRGDVSNGAIGPVRYSSAAAPTTPNGGVPSDDLTLVGASGGAVGLHDVAAGSVSATSTDAVNGSQLYALESQAAGGNGLDVAYDDNTRGHVTLGGALAPSRVGVSNLADGVVADGSSDAVTGSQLYATNQSVGVLGQAVTGLSTTVAGYGGRLNTLDDDTAANAAAIAAVGGRMTTAELNIASLDGRVTINTGAIAANASAIGAVGDRVTAAETNITGLDGRVTANTGAIAALDTRVTANAADIVTVDARVTSVSDRVTANTGAIAALDTRVTANTADIVTVDARVTGVSDLVTANTGDIATLGTRVTGIADSVTALDGRLGAFSTAVADGGVGPVQYSDAASPTTPNGGVPSNELTLVGAAAAPVGLHNVAAGTLSATSTDAVNGSQLYAIAATVTGDTGLAVAYDDAGRGHVTLGGVGAAARVGLSNLADGIVAAGSGDAVTGGQLYATDQSLGTLGATVATVSNTVTTLDTRVTDLGDTLATVSNSVTGLGHAVDAVSGDVATLASGIDNGALGPVRYSDAATPTSPNGGVPSQDLTLVGADATAPVALHNLADGRVAAGSSDAVTGGQLYATNSSIATVGSDVERLSGVVTGLGGTLSTVSGDVAALGERYTDLDDAFTSFSSGVSNGAVGPVRYSDAATPTVANGGTVSQDLTLVGAGAGTVGLHNLTDGRIAIGSSDAVTGGQIATIGNAVASTLGGVSYDAATNSFTGDYTYGGTRYATIQDALDAIPTTTDPANGTPGESGIKYFHTRSTEDDSRASGANATAIGAEAVASGDESVAMGNNAQATGTSAVAIGDSATAENGKAVSIGVGNLASGDGAVSIGDPNSAVGEGSVALGKDNGASGTGAIALGTTNLATGGGAIALGSGNVTNGAGAVALGLSNSASGVGAIAIGSDNAVAGDGSLALGSSVVTSAVDTLAIGTSAKATAASALAIGNRSVATDIDAVAVGTDSAATDHLASAYGNSATATKDFSTAIGARAQADAVAGTAVGTTAVVSAFAGTAVGSGATVVHDNSVALGAAVETTRGALANYGAFGLATAQSSNGEIAVAQNMVYTNPETGALSTTGNRQITGVAAGSMDTDAVDVAQLRGVSNTLGTAVASGLGGGASYNAATGQVTGGSYTVSGVTYGSVGDALTALATRDTGTSTGGGTGTTTDPAAVHYGDATGATIALAPGGTLVSNVAAGGLTAGSTDAVNGSQLAATDARVDANTTAIAGLDRQVADTSGAIATLAGKVDSGAIGTVQYSSAATPTTSNGGARSNDVTLVGADASAPVALHDVAAGTIASGSTDAVNGGQLAVTNARVATVETTADTALALGQGAVRYDDAAHAGVTLGGASAATPVAVHNVADGSDAHDAVNVGQLVDTASAALGQAEAYTDDRVARLAFDLGKVKKDQAAGTAGALALAGMPQPYEAGRGMVSMGAGTFQGQSAIAVGLAKALSDEHTVVKIGATYNSRGSVGANAGVGYQF